MDHTNNPQVGECDTGSIPETVMNDVPIASIGDFENTVNFPGEETSLG